MLYHKSIKYKINVQQCNNSTLTNCVNLFVKLWFKTYRALAPTHASIKRWPKSSIRAITMDRFCTPHTISDNSDLQAYLTVCTE